MLEKLELLEVDEEDTSACLLYTSMETLNARSARIDVEYIQRLVILHLQYMRVPAEEQLWGTHQNAALDGRVVVAGITADMLHQHLRPIHRETENP